ncbi:MAG: nucleotidyl transferase AbiEii/AbiGii toxin family protein [Deltaproteobacteria bacterium]|nr:nucleotidyl transferase AbiEii/AbiGii toxin family protein [Deltaproteobacteria bacterium]
MDIDLLGKIDNSLEVIVAVMKDACEMEVEPDGMAFHPETVTAARITEGAEYEGVRCRVRGSLGNVRISLQIDIGFGDVVVPGPCKFTYPALLDFPPPELNGYTKESTIAEKFQAMVRLGVLNSRMKDFYDIWFLSRTFDFRGETLAEAIEKTFENRNTPITVNPTVFDLSFTKDEDKKVQWLGFIKKAKITDAPGWANYHRHVVSKKTFAYVDSRIFRQIWNWARRRHNSKSRKWVKRRYFRSIDNRNWSFFATRISGSGKSDLVDLYHADHTKIVRHVKVRSLANPYSVDWQGYFTARKTVKYAEPIYI